jgi:hypothetical protein
MRKVSFTGSMLACAALCLLASSCASSASKACSKLSTLCGAELSSDDLRDCAETINAASQETKIDVSKKILRCTDLAESCAEAVGCAAGVGASVVIGLADQFQKGFNRSAPDHDAVSANSTRHTTTSHVRVTGERREEQHVERYEEHREPPQLDRKDERRDGRPAVRYLSVGARPGSDTFGNYLIVSIELEVLSDMELVAPVVKVNALCGSQTDTTDAFRRDLSQARAGDRRADTIKLFSTHLTEPAELCDLTLSLTEGSTPPLRYCLRKGITRPGKC